jgi:ribosomal-protein-alanine N-acetyltransferase
MVRFGTERLIVKSLDGRSNDDRDVVAQAMLRIISPGVAFYLPGTLQAIETPEEAAAWVTEQTEQGDLLAVRDSSSQLVIGVVVLTYAPESDGSTVVRIGYNLEQAFQGQGRGTELVAGLVDWATNNKQVSKLVGMVEADNAASIKVLKRNGFRRDTPALPSMICFERETLR